MSKVDRELAEIEARRAEASPGAGGVARKGGVGAAVKRWAKNLVLRWTSTKR